MGESYFYREYREKTKMGTETPIFGPDTFVFPDSSGIGCVAEDNKCQKRNKKTVLPGSEC